MQVAMPSGGNLVKDQTLRVFDVVVGGRGERLHGHPSELHGLFTVDLFHGTDAEDVSFANVGIDPALFDIELHGFFASSRSTDLRGNWFSNCFIISWRHVPQKSKAKISRLDGISTTCFHTFGQT